MIVREPPYIRRVQRGLKMGAIPQNMLDDIAAEFLGRLHLRKARPFRRSSSRRRWISFERVAQMALQPGPDCAQSGFVASVKIAANIKETDGEDRVH